MSKQAGTKQNRPRKKRISCPHCVGGPETYSCLGRRYKFDVDEARRIVLDGRSPQELEPEDVRYSVDLSRIYPEHLQHVDIQYPGIIAHYWFEEADGTLLHGHVLIDGHHRAARCLELGVPYFVHVLSEEESRQVTLRAPDISRFVATLNPSEMTHDVCHS